MGACALPLLYSQGFNTRPRIQLASALPLGITTECEMLDIALKEKIELDGVRERILAVSPDGLRVYEIHEVDIHEPALQTRVRSAEYRVQFPDGFDLADLQQRIDTLLARPTILIEIERKRRTTQKDLRPLIHDIHINENNEIIMHVAVGDQGNVRPEDVLTELGIENTHYNIHRQRIYLD